MFINEVCHVVGLTKKSIRFYEENGLLNPKRNSENDYRVYTTEDIEKLKKIKFLRELNVSIREIKMLEDGSLNLESVMNERMQKISEEEAKFLKVKKMCKDIIDSKETYESIDITNYFHRMNTLNKEGFTMREGINDKTKKIMGAVTSSLIFSALFIFLVIMITYFQLTEDEKMSWFIYFFIIAILATPILGIIGNLIARIKEINGGEEDEASKY
ncbi:MAG: MerR family transcriptional regulator [Bacilli bacterium]|nr:MerR family transcriptional regulator [Bacilli bacterium]